MPKIRFKKEFRSGTTGSKPQENLSMHPSDQVNALQVKLAPVMGAHAI